METVKLVTASGGFVAETRVLPFIEPAEVLVWGERVFTLDTSQRTSGGLLTYREAFTTVVTPAEVDRSLGLVCPEHDVRFATIEAGGTPGRSRRTCEHGETWRFDGRRLTRA